ncbi:hypothetical protein M2360_004627 [Rhizobium sp. SG_E_25_P2]|jgi:hypothetical protein|uniref:hypothetical protein n=1 Tax=Rhizobium sp. SG_E_25_P2 TaxID=2879942 RepID=UPI002475F80C|nr:hypothetical protein [Rhizobium sp. SG_E_25_P2]MDH6269200.1 hypothetical protein [Rhizobium sp. SG_E_25_P2]
METSDYPWSTLGIARTTDAAVIRKAYAIALKSARPDEDPEAFQRLLTARNEALRLAVTAPHGGAILSATADENEANTKFRPVIQVLQPELGTQLPQETDATDIWRLFKALEQVDVAFEKNGDVVAAYSDAFDVVENAPLQEVGQFLGRVIRHIAEGLAHRQPRAFQDVTLQEPRDILGPYEQVLIELDRRFKIFGDERILLNYFGSDAALHFASLLAFAIGQGPGGSASRERPPLYVDDIFILTTFASSKRMLRICDIAKTTGRFPLNVDLFGLFFPYFFALYHRIYWLAALIGLPPVLYLSLTPKEMIPLGGALQSGLILLYVVQCLCVGIKADQLRVFQLRLWVDVLKRRRRSPAYALRRLAELGVASPQNPWLGTIFLFVLAAGIRAAVYGPQP